MRTKIINFFINFITLQLFISCISFPILSLWGIPQSLLAPFGNIIFTPFFTIFLFLSTLIFFAYILCLPTHMLMWCLEKTTILWNTVLSFKIPVPFIACIQPPISICIIVPLCALWIVMHKKYQKNIYAIPLLLSLLCATHLTLYFLYTPQSLIHTLDCHGGTVTILKDKSTLVVIDPGFIGKRISATSWCEYTLLPEIIKKTGNRSIDHFICLRPGKNLFDALEQLNNKTQIHNIYIPWWTNHIPSHCWRSYAMLKKSTINNNGKIHTISTSEKKINDIFLTIKTTNEIRYYHDAQFQQHYVEGIIDNNHISIYAP